MASGLDVRDLRSVRRAAAGGKRESVVLGDDWVAPGAASEREMRESRKRRGFRSLNASPLARKIVTFNLLALAVLVIGVLYLNPSRDNLVYQRARGLVNEAELVASAFEAQMPAGAPVNLAVGDGVAPGRTLQALGLRSGVDVFVHDTTGALVASTEGREERPSPEVTGLAPAQGSTVLTDSLGWVWGHISGLLAPSGGRESGLEGRNLAQVSAGALRGDTTSVATSRGPDGTTIFVVSTPIRQGDERVGTVTITSAAGEIDALLAQEREQLLRVFLVGVVVSIGLSLMLASTIANPLADLAAAAELGRDRNARKMSPKRIRIPDLTARPDEIGRLSGALRGMVSALYERIEGNEQFAADVAHEIKNPLASLRSAVGTLRVVKREDQKQQLLDVIDHDVRRLDRLVSDISNASRLDSELVKEEEEAFDLLNLMRNLTDHLGHEAEGKGVDFITDFPGEPIVIQGLESRLAQVFVNLITNAISFCEDGDAIRVWVRCRENRVLVVVEDTGPGIPESALTKVFTRFYSERPETHFGNNSGLGLAISKQIVEAHGGVIWAENIHPTDADPTSDPLGARFVVGLPV